MALMTQILVKGLTTLTNTEIYCATGRTREGNYRTEKFNGSETRCQAGAEIFTINALCNNLLYSSIADHFSTRIFSRNYNSDITRHGCNGRVGLDSSWYFLDWRGGAICMSGKITGKSFKQICFIFNSIVCHSNIHHSRLFTKRGTMWKQ